MRRPGLLLVVVLLGACASREEATEVEAPEGPARGTMAGVIVDPAATFDLLEERLLDADRVEIDFAVSSEGAFVADVVGSLKIAAEVHLQVKGKFAGKDLDAELLTEGNTMQLRLGERWSQKLVRPFGLEEALLLGLTRMGLLHNIARLSAAALPDGAEGRLPCSCFLFASSTAETMSFGVFYGGRKSADARLRLNAEGLPLERHQTVTFASGTMKAVETYATFELGRESGED